MRRTQTPQFVRYAICGLIFAIAIVSRSQAAEAFQCEDEAPMPVLLVPLVDAPLNSHIWVTGGPASDFKLCSADKNCISVKVRHSKYSSQYELIPKGLLAPQTQYTVSALVKTQVLRVMKPGDDVEQSRRSWNQPLFEPLQCCTHFLKYRRPGRGWISIMGLNDAGRLTRSYRFLSAQTIPYKWLNDRTAEQALSAVLGVTASS